MRFRVFYVLMFFPFITNQLIITKFNISLWGRPYIRVQPILSLKYPWSHYWISSILGLMISKVFSISFPSKKLSLKLADRKRASLDIIQNSRDYFGCSVSETSPFHNTKLGLSAVPNFKVRISLPWPEACCSRCLECFTLEISLFWRYTVDK